MAVAPLSSPPRHPSSVQLSFCKRILRQQAVRISNLPASLMKKDSKRAHCSPRELTNSKVRDSIIKLVSVFKSKQKGVGWGGSPAVSIVLWFIIYPHFLIRMGSKV